MYRVTLIYIATGQDYASAWYKRLARPAAFIPPVDRYVCRRDRAGVVYDKAAMLQVSRMLATTAFLLLQGITCMIELSTISTHLFDLKLINTVLIDTHVV